MRSSSLSTPSLLRAARAASTLAPSPPPSPTLAALPPTGHHTPTPPAARPRDPTPQSPPLPQPPSSQPSSATGSSSRVVRARFWTPAATMTCHRDPAPPAAAPGRPRCLTWTPSQSGTRDPRLACRTWGTALRCWIWLPLHSTRMTRKTTLTQHRRSNSSSLLISSTCMAGTARRRRHLATVALVEQQRWRRRGQAWLPGGRRPRSPLPGMALMPPLELARRLQGRRWRRAPRPVLGPRIFQMVRISWRGAAAWKAC